MITTNNYLNYFLLYADNELSANEKVLVKTFIKEHPEYKEALQQLLLTKLKNEITIKPKINLLKPSFIAHEFINEQNYTFYFAASVDGTLTSKEKAVLNSFLSLNPIIKEEFKQWKKTKLAPENIIYTNKASLLKQKTKKPKAIWFSIAAAALLILSFGFYFFTQNYQNAATVVSAENNIKPDIAEPSPIAKKDEANFENTLTTKETSDKTTTIKNDQKDKAFSAKGSTTKALNNHVNPVLIPVNNNELNTIAINYEKETDNYAIMTKSKLENFNAEPTAIAANSTLKGEELEGEFKIQYNRTENIELENSSTTFAKKKKGNLWQQLKQLKNKWDNDEAINFKLGKKHITL